MIGTVAVAGRWRRMRHTSRPLSTGQVQVEQHEVGRLLGAGLQGGVAAGDQFHLDVAAALERVAG